jgi:hypothetical protein
MPKQLIHCLIIIIIIITIIIINSHIKLNVTQTLITQFLTYTIFLHYKIQISETCKKEQRRGRAEHYRELETPDVDKIESRAWLKFGKLFPENIGFMVAIDDQVVSSSDYEVYILKDLNVTIETCRKLQEKSQTIQCTTDACSDRNFSHNQAANIGHQELAIQCELSRESRIINMNINT